MTDFNAVYDSMSSSISNQADSIATDAQADMTDPENLMKLKFDMDNYATMMQTELGIESALQKLREAIAQSLGQA